MSIMSSTWNLMRCGRNAGSLFYYSTKAPPRKITIVKPDKLKQAAAIKKLYNQNKKMFGQLLKSKPKKVSNAEEAKVTKSPLEAQESFVELKLQNQGPNKRDGLVSEEPLKISLTELESDLDLNATKFQDSPEENDVAKMLETNWMTQISAKRFVKRFTKVSPQIPGEPTQFFTKFPLPPLASKPVTSEVISRSFPSEAKYSAGTPYSFPSVTRILSATMSPEQAEILRRWEEKMKKELGEDGFWEYKAELFRNGKDLHSNLQLLLSGQPVDDSKIPGPIQGHWKSLQKVLGDVHSVAVLESYVSHPELRYNGIIDCVAMYRGKLVLIDWKTSEKPKPFISNTYDTPVQIAAYVGAINADPTYKLKVTEGLVVIAYKDGKDCQVFNLTPSDISKYWDIWVRRLKLFQIRETNDTEII